MQGVNGLYADTKSEKKEAFARLEQLRRKGTIVDDDVELASYREENKVKLISGLTNEDFLDFEDCLQMECAKSYGADYIVTRNVSDYATSEIKAITPKEYLEI